MGGVDRCDQLRGSYCMESAIKSSFWYKKCFFGLLGISVSNMYIIWLTGGDRIKKSYVHSIFMEELFESLVGDPRQNNRAHITPPPPPDQVRLKRDPPHFCERPASEGKDSKKHCVYCKAVGVKKLTRLICDQCKQPLCSPLERNCFKMYHTVTELPKPSRKSAREKKKLPSQARSPPSACAGPKRAVGRPRLRPPSDDEDSDGAVDLTKHGK
jgi:hypothetical protein